MINKYQTKKKETRQKAIEWQESFADGKKYSYEELAEWDDYFMKMARKYGLFEEMRENGII